MIAEAAHEIAEILQLAVHVTRSPLSHAGRRHHRHAIGTLTYRPGGPTKYAR